MYNIAVVVFVHGTISSYSSCSVASQAKVLRHKVQTSVLLSKSHVSDLMQEFRGGMNDSVTASCLAWLEIHV